MTRINVEPTTSGDDFAQLMLATLPKGAEAPDLTTLALSNDHKSTAEKVPFSALSGRIVSDMGFG
jgi:nuclear protein localization family protein 4